MAEPQNPTIAPNGSPIPTESLANGSDGKVDDIFTPEGSESAPGEQQTQGTPVSGDEHTTQTPETPGPSDQKGDEQPPVPELKVEEVVNLEPDKINETQKKFLEDNKEKLTPEQAQKFGITQEPKLFAGKFATVVDLRAAFANLGGDPNRYAKPEQLEEAYAIRQAEFTRVRQEQAKAKEFIDNPPAAPLTPEQIATNVISKLDFSKIEDAKQLVEQLIPALISNLPQPEKQMTPEQIAASVQPVIAKREAIVREITEVENDIPRLKLVRDANGIAQPNPFRDAFAGYVQTLKQSGQYVSLKEAAKSYIQANEEIIKTRTDQKAKEDAAKGSAQPGKETGESIPGKKSPEQDILSGIMGAYEEHKGKFGF